MKLDRQLIREGKAPAPSKNEVKELPQNFKTWQAKNAKRIAKATEQGKLPHWYRDNQKLIEGDKLTKKTVQQRAKERHEARTPEQIERIQKDWLKRNRKQCTEQAKKALIGKTASNKDIERDIHFTIKGIKEAINQPHKHYYYKNKAITNIRERIEKATYIGCKADTKGRPRLYHYLETEIRGEPSYVVIKEEEGLKTFYSIIEKKRENQ